MDEYCTEHDFVLIDQGGWRCTQCSFETDIVERCVRSGLVDDSILDSEVQEELCLQLLRDTTPIPINESKNTYVWRYHFNERMAQALLTGPGVPANIVAWLRMYYYTLVQEGRLPGPSTLAKADIGDLCHLCPVPLVFKYYYRSQAQKRNLFVTFSGYAERWYALREALGATPFPRPNEKQLYTLRLYSQEANTTWENLRHTHQCIIMGERSTRCHITYSCRKNFPQIFYILHQLCKLLGYHDLLPLFPVDNQKKTLSRLNGYWKDICHSLQWTYEPLPVYQNSRKRKARHPPIMRAPPVHPLYTLRRRGRRRYRVWHQKARHTTRQKLTVVSVPLKKSRGAPAYEMWVYDIGSWCVSRRVGESL